MSGQQQPHGVAITRVGEMTARCLGMPGRHEAVRTAGGSVVAIELERHPNRLARAIVAQGPGGQGIVQGRRVEWLFRMLRRYRMLTGTSGIRRNTLAREPPGGGRSQ